MKRLLFFISGLLFLFPAAWGQAGPQEPLSLEMYKPLPANTCTNKASYVYTQSGALRSELGLKGRRCDDYIIFRCFPVWGVRIADIPRQPEPFLPGTDASLQPAIPERAILPDRNVIQLSERAMHYRSAEMVMQSWQNATGWQNTTITIKNTRL